MSGPDVEGVLAGLVDTALRVESQHDPGCPGDERYCVLHCPVPVQVEVPLAHVAAAVLAEVRAWLESEGAVGVAQVGVAQVGVHAIESCEPDPSVEQYAASVLAALAAQVAPSRVPGEGS